jgi:hypothetical protein
MVPQVVEDAPLELALNDDVLGSVSVGGNRDLFQAEGAVSSLFPVFVSEDIDGDLGQPCPETGLESKARQLLIRSDEGFLGQVIRSGDVSAQLKHQVEKIFLFPFEKIVERFLVAPFGFFNQGDVLRFFHMPAASSISSWEGFDLHHIAYRKSFKKPRFPISLYELFI